MASGKFVRTSKFRHVFGEVEQNSAFQDCTPYTNGEGTFVAGNASYICYPSAGGGGPLQLLHREQVGRNPKDMIAKQKLNFHKAKILCQAFNPFDDTMVATGADDCLAFVHKFEAFGKEGPSAAFGGDPMVTLKKHQKKVVSMAWHPTASSVLATGSHDSTVKVWNVEKQEAVTSHDTGEHVQSMGWNFDGSLLAATSKGKNCAIFDPRVADAVAQWEAHPGTKPQSPLWAHGLGDLLIVVGSDASQTRRIGIWDPKKTDKPLSMTDLDQSAGQVLPWYDDDLAILYMAGKGDATITYFELTNEGDMVYPLSAYAGSDSQKGVGFMPKSICDTTKCEIAVALRVGRDTIQPVSFRVPRKNADMFQEDIYPDTPSTNAANTADGYFGGTNKNPEMRSMDPEKSFEKKETTMVVEKSADQLKEELAAALKRIAELEAEVASLKK